MHTLSMTPPDEQWYMDTGATSHMTANRGNLTSYFNISNHIIVGSGHNISVISRGNALLTNSHTPLALKNVLHAPKLIKNLSMFTNLPVIMKILLNLIPFVYL